MSDAMILSGARVIDPANGIDEIRDVAVADGVFVAPADVAHANRVRLDGLVVAPGFIDLHVHLRDPGQTYKEDIATGTRAAAAGGFTTVLAMPNTLPVVDTPEVVSDILRRAREQGSVRVLQTACLTWHRKGTELTDFAALKAAGAAALTDDGGCIQDDALMLEALRRAREVGLPVVDHCECYALSAGGSMNEGAVARRLGVRGQSPASEDLIVARNIVLARESGHPVHLQHLSTAGAVELLRFAQASGIPVSGEACPHHLFLTEEACVEQGTNAKMNPPLRTDEDRRVVLRALRDGVIGSIATDHAPHAAHEKALPFSEAPFGIVGLETAVALCLTELYSSGLMALSEIVAAFTCAPRNVLGLDLGTLDLGAPADITVLDLNREFTIDVTTFRSRSRNCPYHGWRCKGKPVGTMVAGKWAHREWNEG